MKKHHSRKQKIDSIENVSIGIIERHSTGIVGPLASTLLLTKNLYKKLQQLNVTNPKILIFRMKDEILVADMYLYVHYYDHFKTQQEGHCTVPSRGRNRPGPTGPTDPISIDRVNEEMRALNETVLYVNVKYNCSQGRNIYRVLINQHAVGRIGNYKLATLNRKGLKRRRALRTMFNRIPIKPICRKTARAGNLRNFMFFWDDMSYKKGLPNLRKRRYIPNSIFYNELYHLGVLITDLMNMREAEQPQEKLDFLHEFLFDR